MASYRETHTTSVLLAPDHLIGPAGGIARRLVQALCIGFLLSTAACGVLRDRGEELSNPVRKSARSKSRVAEESYVIDGKRYRVMADAAGFVEHGLANWYGRYFHQRRTASGEPFDMNELTAAHKTLPLDTVVRVTNLRNNRQVMVRVNDRGPFGPGRIIDLSYAAAKELGMIAAGKVEVRVEALQGPPEAGLPVMAGDDPARTRPPADQRMVDEPNRLPDGGLLARVDDGAAVPRLGANSAAMKRFRAQSGQALDFIGNLRRTPERTWFAGPWKPDDARVARPAAMTPDAVEGLAAGLYRPTYERIRSRTWVGARSDRL